MLVHIITVNKLDLPIGGTHENPDPENQEDEHDENGRTACLHPRRKVIGFTGYKLLFVCQKHYNNTAIPE